MNELRLAGEPSLMIPAKVAHRSAKREGGPYLHDELRLAGEPSLMIQAKVAHRSVKCEGGYHCQRTSYGWQANLRCMTRRVSRRSCAAAKADSD